ncbi:MAG: helix-turn-helix transcriptional regulator [Pedobacter sp.]|nr:helix-turn-helix transcriptional regulator [Chitinophagaceae bacterium]
MKTSENKKKFLELVDRHDPSTMAEVKFRIDNRDMLRESQDMALKILTRLDELGWGQVDLAKEMEVAPQQITKILSGKTNFEIQTLLRLQNILDIPLLASYYEKRQKEHLQLLASYSKHSAYNVAIPKPKRAGRKVFVSASFRELSSQRRSSKIEYSEELMETI